MFHGIVSPFVVADWRNIYFSRNAKFQNYEISDTINVMIMVQIMSVRFLFYATMANQMYDPVDLQDMKVNYRPMKNPHIPMGNTHWAPVTWQGEEDESIPKYAYLVMGK